MVTLSRNNLGVCYVGLSVTKRSSVWTMAEGPPSPVGRVVILFGLVLV